MPLRGFYRLRRDSAERTASARTPDQEDALKAVYSLIPTETMAAYHFGKAMAGAQESGLLVVLGAWLLLAFTFYLRVLGTMKAKGGRPEWLVVGSACVAFILIVLMDGGTFWLGLVVAEGDRWFLALVALIVAGAVGAWKIFIEDTKGPGA
jgi:hypothetical protein